MKSRTVSFVALCSALSMVMLYAISVLPTVRLALLAAVSAASAVTVIRCGKRAGAAQYAVTSILAFLLLPDKGVAAVYALFVGHYAVCKSAIEGLDKLGVEWLLKLVLFNICAAVAYMLMNAVIGVQLPIGLPMLFVGGNVVFIIYDIALTVLIDFIVKRMRIV